MAFAGLGNPLKSSDCFLSILNLASLKAENITIRNADSIKNKIDNLKEVKPEKIELFININLFNWNIKMEGRSPKLITSAKLSSCFPNSLQAFSIFAKKPSKKSNIADIPTK